MKELTKLCIVCLTTLLLHSCFGGGSNTPDNEMSFHGVSFKYPSYWTSETEELKYSYHIECKERFASGTMLLVSFFEGEGQPGELLINYIDGVHLSSEQVNVTTKFTGLDRYGNYNCQFVEYEIEALRTKSYGKAYAFTANGKSVLIVEQSERHYDLKHDKFKLIRESFVVDAQDKVSNPEE